MMNRLLVRLALLLAVLVVAAAGALVVLIVTTSAPPTLPAETAASPNSQIQTIVDGYHSRDLQLTNLTYQGATGAKTADIQCESRGQWNLKVNPQDVVGHPFAALPTPEDWTQAARAIATAHTICLAQIVLTWYGHDPAHPVSDIWTAVLPASIAPAIDGPTLRRYALRHARQM